MLKFFRKYNKIILVFGGTLLMVVFLVPQAIQNLRGDPRKRTVATLSDGTKFKLGDRYNASAERRVLATFAPTFAQSLLGAEESPSHWLMLDYEAEKAGLTGGIGDGSNWIPQLAQELVIMSIRQQFGTIPPQLRDQIQQQVEVTTDELRSSVPRIAQGAGMTQDDLYRTLARGRGVYRLVATYGEAARWSDIRAAKFAVREGSTAVVNAAFLPGTPEAFEIGEPSEEELVALFEAHKDEARGEGEHGFGYRLPRRVKLAWLKIDRNAINGAVELDPIEVREQYESDRARYPGEFADEKLRIESSLRQSKVEVVLVEAQRAVQTEVAQALRGLTQDGVYWNLPSDWDAKRPRLEAMAQAVVDMVKERTGTEIPLPTVVVRAADWLTAEDIRSLSGIGSSRIRIGQNQVTMEQAVFQVRELDGDERLSLQVGLPATAIPAMDSLGNRYYFTVLEALPASPPLSIDEVREQVREDWRKLKAYETLVASQSDWEQIAIADGIEGVQSAFDSRLPQPEPEEPEEGEEPAPPPALEGAAAVRDDMVIQRSRNLFDPRFNLEAFRNQVIETAEQLDATILATDLPADTRTIVMEHPDQLGLIVAVITRVVPLTEEGYRMVVPSQIAAAQQQEIARAVQASETFPFTLEGLSERHGYTAKADATEDEFEDTPAEEPEAESGE